MIHFFATTYLYAVFKLVFSDHERNVLNFFIVDQNAALLNVASRLALAGNEFALHEKVEDVDPFSGNIVIGKLSRRHVGIVTAACKERVSRVLRLFCLLFAMNELREVADALEDIVSKDEWPYPSYGRLLYRV